MTLPDSWRLWRVPRAGLLLLVLLGLVHGCERSPATPSPGELPIVSAGDSVDESLASLTHPGEEHQGFTDQGQADACALELQVGEAILLEVEQEAVDVVLHVLEPDLSPWLTWDTPTGRSTPERLCFVARHSGSHTLRITPDSGGGRYTVRLLRRRVATEADRLCHEASTRFQAAFGAVIDGQRSSEAQIEDFKQAAWLWGRAEEPFLAALAWREAASLLRKRDSAEQAVQGFQRALEQARLASSAFLEVSVLNRMGLALAEMGDLEQARARLEEAAQRAGEAGDSRGRASAMTNLGKLDDLQGHPHRALDRLAEALALWRELDNPLEIAQTLQHMATSYGVLDDHDRALDLLDQALELFRESGNVSRQGNVLLDQGWIHYLRGEPAKGIPALKRVLEIQRSEGDLHGEAVALDRLGTLWKEAGKIRQAEDAYLRSLELSIGNGSAFNAAGTIANLGCLYAETGRLEEARKRLSEASERYLHFDDPRAESHIEYCSALVAAAEGDLRTAIRHISSARDIVDRLRDAARHRGHFYRPIWLWQEYAELEVQLLLERYQTTGSPRHLEEAFQAADLAHARTLFEKVIETRVGVRTSADESLLLEERRLEIALNRWARQRSDGSATLGSLEVRPEREIRRLRAELIRVRAAIRASDPRHGSTAPRPVTVAVAQQLLTPGTVLLSYFLSDEGSYLIVIGEERFEAHRLGSSHSLESHAEAFHQAAQRSRSDPFQWRMIAGKLTRMLLPSEVIPAGTKRLLIIPDGLLHYIPFAALSSPFDEQKLLVHDLEVSYAPSVSVLAQLRRRNRQRAWHPMVVFADPVYSLDDNRLPPNGGHPQRASGQISSDGSGPRYFPRLPSSAEEARAIADLAGPSSTRAHIGFDANVEALRKMDLAHYGILHFATHAWIDERFPELSGLALSRFSPQGDEVESDLRLHEIHGLQLDAELTVLSGCETALGEWVEGNGLEGFAHGFLYAGSSRVLVSLWRVDDRATARLMEEFYRVLLVEEVPPATALRSAQNWLRAHPQWEAPFYWAPFVLQGKN